MVAVVRSWFNKYFSHPEAIVLIAILAVSLGLIIGMGEMLAPVLASIVIAYLLEWLIVKIQVRKLPRLPVMLVVYIGFLSIFVLSCVLLFPLLWNQLSKLFADLPAIISKTEIWLFLLAENFPEFVSEAQISNFIAEVGVNVKGWGKLVLSYSLATVPSIITWIIYLVLIPILVFFMLKDRDILIKWFHRFFPEKRQTLVKVYEEVNEQIGNYIRGKVSEIIIVAGVTYLVFWYYDLRYAVLLAVVVGLSVIIPYVGAVVATIPVLMVGFLQFGFSADFGYLLAVYFVVQALDGNVLVPLLFSEAVNLHPVAIIVAILVFGGIWGFWGVFFAIPLATLVKAVLYAWPSKDS